MRPPRLRRAGALLAALALVLVACGDGGDGGDQDPGTTAASAEEELAISIASFDLAVGQDRRLLAGVQTGDLALVGFGEVTFQVGFLGEEEAAEGSVEVSTSTARFLPVPGMEPEGEDRGSPAVLLGRDGAGVYEGRVDLDRPGFYGVRVIAELDDGTTREGQAIFQVQPETQVLDIGEPAPATDNPTIADVEAGDVEPVALDSRAQGDDPTVPDTHLHDTVIADVLEEGRPLVVTVATPVYCQSRFCGPLTEQLADLAQRYEDVAAFVHLEVWEDFEEAQLNAAAAEWIQTEAGGNEPWVFLVGEDGTVAARWDNVLDVAELEGALQAL